MAQQILTNQDLQVIIDSSHGGRIQQIFHKNVPLFYVPKKFFGKEWQNFGGDFLWIAPQQKWGGWPPIKEFDAMPWFVDSSKDKITVFSQEWNGIVLSRKIYFSSDSLIVENSIFNNSLLEIEWGLWNISQIEAEKVKVRFKTDCLKVFDYPEGNSEDSLLKSRAIKKVNNEYFIVPGKCNDFKIGGVVEDNKIICQIGDNVLEKEIILTEKHQETEFPHHCNIEIYRNSCYLEAELIWPMTVLSSGESYLGVQKYTVREG